MEHQSNDFEKMTGSLEDRFDFQGPVAGTLTAQAYRAVDTVTGREVTVWRTRGPLRVGEIGRFQERLLALRRVPRVEAILSCGIDCYNRGFAVLRAYDGRKIDCPASSADEIEERFDACAAIVDSLHKRRITCGDLCLDSFLLNDRGGVSLFAVLGDVALEQEDEDFNRNRYIAFRPSEQRNGGTQTASVDAYALARLGEGLCAVRVNEESLESKTTPPWLKGLLESTASEELRKKHDSATLTRLPRDDEEPTEPGEGEAQDRPEVGDAAKIQAAAREELESPAQGKAKGFREGREDDDEESGTEPPTGGGFDSRGRPGLSLGDLVSPQRIVSLAGDVVGLFRNPSRVLLLAFLNFFALGFLLYSYVAGRAGAIALESREVAEVTKRDDDTTRLTALYQSDSPTAYQEITELLSQAPDPARRLEIGKVLTSRARRQGLGRTADVVLGQMEDAKEPATFGGDDGSRPFLRLLDPALSSNARLEEIARLYQVSPRVACILAAASALDTGDAEAYRGLFAKAVAEQVGIANGGEHNPYALMLLLPDVHDLFSEDIVAMQEKIPASDVVWLLEELGRQGRPEVSTAAQIAERRQSIPGGRAVFLRELRRSAALRQRLRTAMVSGALGNLSMDDVRLFDEWYGQGASRVLEATVLTASSSSLKRAAFDALSAKPIADPYVAKIMEFVRSSYGNDSSRFAGVVAAIDLRDVVGADVLNSEFDVVRDAPRSQEFLRQLTRGAPPEVIEILLRRYSDSMDQLDIVDLLGHPSAPVRVAAVSSLTKVNDIMLLKLISQSYDDETDPRVRAVYEEKISLVKERAS